VLAVYDKKFTKKNQPQLNKMMTIINKSLTSSMKYPYFKKAYQAFINFFLNKVKTFSVKKLRSPDNTARNFVKKHWNRFLLKERKKWAQAQAKKEAKKRNKKNKNLKKK